MHFYSFHKFKAKNAALFVKLNKNKNVLKNAVDFGKKFVYIGEQDRR